MSAKVGRNEPCSCGSGLKSKRCCGVPDQAPPVGKQAYVVFGGLMAAALLVAVVASARVLFVEDVPQPTTQPVAAATGGPPFPKPAGPAPPGKVWHDECGQYHDAPFTIGPVQVPLPQQQPIGAPRPGQVWSEEHQHYH